MNGNGNKAPYLLAHDLGTTGDKAVLYSTDGRQIGACSVAYPTNYPAPHFVEQEPTQWWDAVCRATRKLLQQTGIQPEAVAAVSFSAHMMGCLLVDEHLSPLRPSIIWADTRAEQEARRLEEHLGAEHVYKITGHRVSSSYTAAKIAWLKRHEPDTYRKARYSLQAKDYIIYRLTGQVVTDYSDACGTNLFDLRSRQWSAEIADALDIDVSLMPEPVASTQQVGHITSEAAADTGLAPGTPVVAGGGDGACAATGAGVTEPGSTYVVIGTSAWIATVSQEPLFDPEMRTFNWITNDGARYSPCGTMQSAGFSYAWLRDLILQITDKSSEELDHILSTALDGTTVGAGGVLFLPYLMGERSPRWNPRARGTFVGLTAQTGPGELVRSVLEGVALNLKSILNAFGPDQLPAEITAIGGGATNDRWIPILASAWNKRILIPRHLDDATSLGAAICAGVGASVLDDLSIARRFNPVEREVAPDPHAAQLYEQYHQLFDQTYRHLTGVYDRLDELAAPSPEHNG